MNNTRLTDTRFFTECLDPSVPELCETARLAEEGDVPGAKRRFAAYVRKTLRPDVYLRGEKEALEPRAEEIAEACRRAMEHTFVSCRVPYTFGETIDWCANPTYNNYCEWPWQLNRHPEWLAMAQAYILTGDEAIPAEWARQFMSWAVQAQVPENESGFATICWRTIEAGLRMKRWIYAIHAFLYAVDDETLTVFCKSIWEHGWRLRNFCTSHNWLIMEMAGLAQIGLFFPFLRESAEWLSYVHRRLEGEIRAQVYPDGMQYELAPGYHQVCVGNYEDVVDMIRLRGSEVPAYLIEGLKKMTSVYPKIAAPDLCVPAVNDSGRGNAAANLKEALSYMPDDLPDRDVYRWFASERAEGRPPEFKSLLLEYSGMVIFRSSWEKDAFWAYMDASPFGKAHQHEDKLSVQIWAYGHELMPEAGTFDYDTSEMRRYVLSTRGHNTARVDGFDQNRRDGYAWSPEDISEKADVRFETGETRETAEASYDEGYGPGKIRVRHTRKLIYLKNEPGIPPMFVAVDRFEGDGPHSVELIWHLHDNPTELDGLSAHNVCPDGAGLTVASSSGGIRILRGVKTPEFQGWLPKFGIGDVEHYPVPTVLNTFRFDKSHRTVTVLCPFAGGVPEVRSVEASSDADASDFVIVLRDGSAVRVRE